MRFTQPFFLFLFLLLPVLVWLGRPSRGPSRRREWISLALRLIIVLCLILSLAGLEIARPADEVAVVFLVDASDSMPDQAKGLALTYVQDALQAMKPDDQAAVILFGADALVERPMSSSRTMGPITSIPSTIQTDLAEAIRLGLALYPPGAARRMVILSDGAATTGDALEAARLARAAGVEIVVVPYAISRGAEALLISVEAPAHLRQGEEFGLEVVVEATRTMQAGIQVFAGSDLVFEGSQDLNAGRNSFVIPLTAGAPSFASYRVQISPAADVFYQNDVLATFSQIGGPPTVLLVAPPAGEELGSGQGVRPDEFSQLLAGLRASRIEVQAVKPSGLPSELPLLAEYASIVLVDVPARELSRRQMEAVQTYVRDLGGGLVAVGGVTSYGVGGYFRTPLEDTLPVEMQLKDQQRRPRLTMVFVIDKSGSMSESSGGVSKVDLAKEAAIRSVELLSPSDKIGVVAFDDSAAWVVNITDLAAPQDVINRIGSIRADGGTNIMSGVQAVAGVLPADDAQLKHVILLTDGGADPTGIADLVGQMFNKSGITLSTVAVGNDAAPWLPTLSQAGGGRHHFTNDPTSIPSIFTEETTLATRAYIIEEEFFPTQVGLSPILAGIEEVPALLGYVGTTIKPAANEILQSAQEDPILASWQYGLGKAVAWTSDASGRWASNWLTWESFPKFWAQAVQSTISEGIASDVQVTVDSVGDRAKMVLDAQDQSGEYLNGYTMQANIVAPDGKTEMLGLRQVAPGRYEAEFTPTIPGAYLIRATGMNPENPEAPLGQTAGWVLSYSAEYRILESDPDALIRIAGVTGGGVAGDDPADAFAHTLQAQRATRPIQSWLLLAAVLLLPFDIAIRRLVITKYDFQRARSRVTAWINLRRPSAQLAPERSDRLAALMRAKDRAGLSGAPAPQGGVPTAPAASKAAAESSPPPTSEPRPVSPLHPDELAEPEPAVPADTSVPAGATASTLLAKKRARREKEN